MTETYGEGFQVKIYSSMPDNVYLSIHMYIYLYIYEVVRVSIENSDGIPEGLNIYLSIYPCIYLSIYSGTRIIYLGSSWRVN